MIQLGNERLFGDDFHLIKGRRVGLVTNPSGVNSALQSTADRLCAAGGVELTALFGPEHGIRGDLEDPSFIAIRDARRRGIFFFGNHSVIRPAPYRRD